MYIAFFELLVFSRSSHSTQQSLALCAYSTEIVTTLVTQIGSPFIALIMRIYFCSYIWFENNLLFLLILWGF